MTRRKKVAQRPEGEWFNSKAVYEWAYNSGCFMVTIGCIPMTPEEIRCFCEAKGATLHVQSSVGTITYSSKGIQIGPTLFTWQGDPLPALPSQQEVLEKADKFIIQPRFGAALEVSHKKFEQLLRT